MSGESEQKTLMDLKQRLEGLKREIATKEGERNSILSRIKNDFGAKDIDDAYRKLKQMGENIEVKSKRREELLKIAQEKLAEYRGRI